MYKTELIPQRLAMINMTRSVKKEGENFAYDSTRPATLWTDESKRPGTPTVPKDEVKNGKKLVHNSHGILELSLAMDDNQYYKVQSSSEYHVDNVHDNKSITSDHTDKRFSGTVCASIVEAGTRSVSHVGI